MAHELLPELFVQYTLQAPIIQYAAFAVSYRLFRVAYRPTGTRSLNQNVSLSVLRDVDTYIHHRRINAVCELQNLI
jgi:hypothetical protein